MTRIAASLRRRASPPLSRPCRHLPRSLPPTKLLQSFFFTVARGARGRRPCPARRRQQQTPVLLVTLELQGGAPTPADLAAVWARAVSRSGAGRNSSAVLRRTVSKVRAQHGAGGRVTVAPKMLAVTVRSPMAAWWRIQAASSRGVRGVPEAEEANHGELSSLAQRSGGHGEPSSLADKKRSWESSFIHSTGRYSSSGAETSSCGGPSAACRRSPWPSSRPGCSRISSARCSKEWFLFGVLHFSSVQAGLNLLFLFGVLHFGDICESSVICPTQLC